MDKYLVDEREPHIIGKPFDALEWWRKHGDIYSTVALVARDVLAMPVSTVASESAFSIGGRVLDSFWSSLSLNMVEALVSSQDWLRTSSGPLLVEETLEAIEKIEEEISLLVDQPSSSVVDDYF